MSSGGDPRAPDTGRWRLIWRLIIAGACLVALATVPLPPNDTDALWYARAAKAMIASGDWLTPHTDVPPLTLWLMALSLVLGGDTPAALRLWHILITLALAAVTYRIARRAAGDEESLLAVVVLMTTQQVLVWSLSPKQDIPLTFFLSLALYSYLLYRGGGRTGSALAAGVWTALAVLTKGPAALGVFALIVAADLVVAWRLASPGHWRWAQVAAGAGVFLLVAAPWFLYEAAAQGLPFVTQFFLERSTAWRFFQGLSVPLPYWLGLVAYVPLLVAGALPWSGVVPDAVREGWRGLRGGAASLRLCLVWMLAVFLVLSLVPGTKSIRYLLPLYPPLAILSARALVTAVAAPRGLWLPAAALGALWVPVLAAAGLGVGRSSPEFWIYLPAVAAFTPAVAGFALAAYRGRGRLAVAVLAAGTLVTYGVFAWTYTHDYEHRWLDPLRTVAIRIERRDLPTDRIYIVGEAHLESAIVNYYLTDTEMVPTDEATLRRAWSETGVLALLSPDVYWKVAPDLHPDILMETPTGLVFVTNR